MGRLQRFPITNPSHVTLDQHCAIICHVWAKVVPIARAESEANGSSDPLNQYKNPLPLGSPLVTLQPQRM